MTELTELEVVELANILLLTDMPIDAGLDAMNLNIELFDPGRVMEQLLDVSDLDYCIGCGTWLHVEAINMDGFCEECAEAE